MKRRTKLAAWLVLLGLTALWSDGFNARASVTSCHSRADCGSPAKGGLEISFTGWVCTTGFVGRNDESGNLFVLTAGHCIVGSGLFARWSNGSTIIGRAAREAFHPGSSADVGALEIDESHASNQVYAGSNTDLMSVTGWVPDAAQNVGSAVCRSGASSGWTCGSIVSADVDAILDGTLIRHTWWTDFPSAKGDSGSPMMDLNGRAIGIAIATTATQTVYSTIEGVGSELGVRPCTDPACS